MPWFACEALEKEPDAHVHWHYEAGGACRDCQFKAHVQAVRFPDDSHVAWLVSKVGEFAPAA